MLDNNFSTNIADFRRDYRHAALDEAQMPPLPYPFFEKWLHEAIQAPIMEPTAMFLATVSDKGQPTARTVLLKGHTPNGLLFFTNYLSRKGQDMAGQQNVALLFYWDLLERQVRIEGYAEKATPDIADNYFQQRPRGSQLGAMASPQSQVIASREKLDELYQTLSDQYAGTDILTRPSHWGGYWVRPTVYEFWQGRTSRLHDRIQYSLQPNNEWLMQRLAP